MRIAATLAALAAALLLGACSEKPQTAGTHQSDGKPWEGAKTEFAAAGWSTTDKLGWEQQLRKRSQGQNEYARTPITP